MEGKSRRDTSGRKEQIRTEVNLFADQVNEGGPNAKINLGKDRIGGEKKTRNCGLRQRKGCKLQGKKGKQNGPGITTEKKSG